MPAPFILPNSLTSGPFSRQQALDAGVTSRMLQGGRFVRLFPRVYVLRTHVMSISDWIRAAQLSMPERAVLSHLTRIQLLGLDIGPRRPFHFTVIGDLHLDVPDVFLHRTEVMPPRDDDGVTPAAAWIGAATQVRLIDLIMIGDWLLFTQAATPVEMAELVHAMPWRPGATPAGAALAWLREGAESLKESEVRTLILACGLPEPEVNPVIRSGGAFVGRVDLLFRKYGVVVEYDGRQHAEDIAQWNRDLVRNVGLDDTGLYVIHVTQEKLRAPRALMYEIYRRLVERGYRGPEPDFDETWRLLFA